LTLKKKPVIGVIVSLEIVSTDFKFLNLLESVEYGFNNKEEFSTRLQELISQHALKLESIAQDEDDLQDTSK